MSGNSRFTIAIHVLTLLASDRSGTAMTSEYIAGSVNTNPVVIRRILAALRTANLVESRGGPGGGWHLLRSAAAITLRDVYRVVEEPSLFTLHRSDPNPRCPVGGTIQSALAPTFESAQVALERDLEKTSIADVLTATGA